MDIRQLGAGATLYLPVEVEGALLGIGAAWYEAEAVGLGVAAGAPVDDVVHRVDQGGTGVPVRALVRYVLDQSS